MRWNGRAMVKKRPVERLSREKVRHRVESFLREWDPAALKLARPVALDRVIGDLRRDGRLEYDESVDLLEHGLLGDCDPCRRPIRIRIDRSLRYTHPELLRSTLAHELAHFIIHANLEVPHDYSLVTPIRQDLVTGKKILTTERDFIEWQANYGGQQLLTPQRPARAVVSAAIAKHFGLLDVWEVHINGARRSEADAWRVISEVAKWFRVSPTYARNTMSDLGILVEHRDSSRRHISELIDPAHISGRLDQTLSRLDRLSNVAATGAPELLERLRRNPSPITSPAVRAQTIRQQLRALRSLACSESVRVSAERLERAQQQRAPTQTSTEHHARRLGQSASGKQGEPSPLATPPEN